MPLAQPPPESSSNMLSATYSLKFLYPVIPWPLSLRSQQQWLLLRHSSKSKKAREVHEILILSRHTMRALKMNSATHLIYPAAFLRMLYVCGFSPNRRLPIGPPDVTVPPLVTDFCRSSLSKPILAPASIPCVLPLQLVFPVHWKNPFQAAWLPIRHKLHPLACSCWRSKFHKHHVRDEH